MQGIDKMFFIFLFFLTCSCSDGQSTSSSGQNLKLTPTISAINELEEIKIFVEQLKIAVRKNDSLWIAKRIHYPQHVFLMTSKKRTIILLKSDDLIKNYSKVFSGKLKKKILNQDEDKIKLDEKTGSSVILGSGGYMNLMYSYKDKKVEILGIFPN
ncbi:MAG TPA: hypothetical protein VMV05_10630 [bacterium]|nr:hypothetical protein [bacterium]